MKKKLCLYIVLALALVFSVSAVMSTLDIVENPVLLSGDPGTVATGDITINNSGTSDFSSVIMGSSDLTGASGTIAGSAVSFGLPSFSLAAGANILNTVVVVIPADQKAGSYMGIINASNDSVNRDTSTLVLTVNGVPGYSAVADSPTIAKGLSGHITVTVTNTGNTDISGMSYSVLNPFVSTTGSDTLSVASISPGPFNINYNSSNTLSVSFNPLSSLPSGTYAGQINLSHSGINMTLPLLVTVRDPIYSVSMPEVVYPASSREVNVSTNVTITNNGDFALTGCSLSFSAPNTWVTGSASGTLNVGNSFAIVLTSTVPENADSGLDKIGILTFSCSEYSKSVDIKTNAESKLEFDSVKVSIDSGSWDSVSNGGTVDDDAKPGSTFAVKVKLENLFNDDTGIDMDDVEVTAVFYEAGEDGDDIEGDTDTFDIDAGDKSSEYEINFDDDMIDWDVSAGKLVMELTATAEDDNGGRHEATFNLSVNVKRESRPEIVFTRVDAPSTVQCGRSFTLYVEGRSIGEDSDDEVVLRIDSSGLGISVKETFEMGAYDGDEDCNALDRDEDDCVNFDFSRSVQVPSNIASGTYKITAKLYRDNENKQTDEESIDIVVDCGTSSSSSSTSSSTASGSSATSTSSPSATTTTKPAITAGGTPSTTTSSVEVFYGGGQSVTPSRGVAASMPTKITDTTKPEGFTESGGYLALLSVISILVIIGIIVLLIYAFTRPAE
ncbi:MAG: hypothetical protein KKD17_05330 [Nanoarchaeota archaeon]|nr:hypothetical protein [Nanoarchaeota archaeon]